MRLLALVVICLVLLSPIALAAPIQAETGKTNGAAWAWSELWKQHEANIGQNNAKLMIRGLERTSPMFLGSSIVRLFNPGLADRITATGTSLMIGLNVDTQKGTAGMSLGDAILNLTVVAGALGAGARLIGGIGRGASTITRTLRLGRFGMGFGVRLFPTIPKVTVKTTVFRELLDLGVKHLPKVKRGMLPPDLFGKVTIKNGIPKLIRLDTQRIQVFSKWLGDKNVLKYVARHEATHAAIHSKDYIQGFGRLSKSAKRLLAMADRFEEPFTNMLTTARYQGNMQFLKSTLQASRPYTVTNHLIKELRTASKLQKLKVLKLKGVSGKAIGTFANNVQKFANKAKAAGKILPSVVSAPMVPKFKAKFKKYKTAKKRSVFKNIFKKKYKHKTAKKYKSAKKYKTKKRSIFKNIFKKKYKKYKSKKYKKYKKYKKSKSKKRSWKRRGWGRR